jgi:site-specific DNA-methyltransferase (adenine-specific)
MINQILHGDCLELMKSIPDKSIDMILCDLPYGTTQNKWDSVIDLTLLWNEYHRVAKETTPIILTCQQPFTTQLINSNFKDFKYNIYWHKKQCTGFLNAKKQPLRSVEEIAIFYKKQCVYNPIMRKGKKQLKNTGGQSSNYNKFTYMPHFSEIYYPTTMLEIPLARFKNGHPTQKPVALFEYLIKTYSNENDLILDNTAGSGTTAIACLNTNRKFIVMEKDETYFNIMKNRIETHQQTPKMF